MHSSFARMGDRIFDVTSRRVDSMNFSRGTTNKPMPLHQKAEAACHSCSIDRVASPEKTKLPFICFGLTPDFEVAKVVKFVDRDVASPQGNVLMPFYSAFI